MATEEVEGHRGMIPSRWKAFLVSLGVDLVLIPLVMVLLFFWPVFILAIAPYIGGALGGRHTDRRTGLWTGGAAAVVMVTVLVTFLLSILTSIEGFSEGFDLFEPIGMSLVVTSYVVAFLFGALGGRHGAISSEETEA